MMYSQDSFSFLSEKMPQNLYQELLSYTQRRRKEETWNYNNKLAGALEQQSSLVYLIGVHSLKNMLLDYLHSYGLRYIKHARGIFKILKM